MYVCSMLCFIGVRGKKGSYLIILIIWLYILQRAQNKCEIILLVVKKVNSKAQRKVVRLKLPDFDLEKAENFQNCETNR